MANIRLLPKARGDLNSASSYYAGISPRVGIQFEDAVIDALDRIARMPQLYALVNARDRLCPIHQSQYLLVYEYDSTADEVIVNAAVHVRSGSRP